MKKGEIFLLFCFSCSVSDTFSALAVHRRRADEGGAAEVKRSRAGRNRCGEDKDGAAEGGAAVRVAEGGTSKVAAAEVAATKIGDGRGR